MNIAQLSSNVRCRLGEGPPSNGQPNIKRQKLDAGANPTVAGTSTSTAITIDNIVEGDEDDDGIEILEDEDDGDAGAAVVAEDAQENATTSTPHAANVTGASTFTPWVLMGLHPNIVTDVKGRIVRRSLISYENNTITRMQPGSNTCICSFLRSLVATETLMT